MVSPCAAVTWAGSSDRTPKSYLEIKYLSSCVTLGPAAHRAVAGRGVQSLSNFAHY